MNLPTEPTWGIAITENIALLDEYILEDNYAMPPVKILAGRRHFITIIASNVLDFIPLTEEQAARIEAAR